MSVYGGPKIVTDGLIVHLDAANTKSYPGSGTTWTDLSGNGNTGSLNNSQSFSSNNGGYIINSNYQNISITQNSTINDHSGNYTYEFMCRPPSQSAYLYPRFFANCNWLETGLHLAGTSNASDISMGFGWHFGGSGYGAVGVSNGAYNKWYYFAFSRIGTTYYAYCFYENTIITDSGSLTFDLSNSNGIRIGANRSGSETCLEHVAFFRRYNIGLTQEQIYQNFYASRGRFSV